ncbi:hypothetical protein CSPX01_10344 [Colletotrichum filicis]|nr:hypothetical protein CSPX01_10344 [Colletotrichum filicis]
MSIEKDDGFAYPGTPEGGIVLHWIVTIFYICVTAPINEISNAITFSADLLVYGHFIIEAAVGFGFIWFRPVDDRLKPRGYPAVGWFPENSPPPQTWWTRRRRTFDWSIGALTDGAIQVLLGAFICSGSLFLIAIDAWTGPQANRADFVHLIIMISLMIIGCFYWWFLIRKASAEEIYKLFGYQFRLLKHGVDDNEDAERAALALMDRLQTATHVLEGNILTIQTVQQGMGAKPVRWSLQQLEGEDKLSDTAEAVIRDLDFRKRHVVLIIAKLESVTAMVRDLVNLRNTHIIERMTARSIFEAYTMRILALLTLCFLPPTFVAGFLDMDYVDVRSVNGMLKLNIEPGLWLYLAVTIPLLLVIIASYLVWDRRNVRKIVEKDSFV